MTKATKAKIHNMVGECTRNKNSWNIPSRYQEIILVAVIFLLSFIPRSRGLDVFSTIDESRWLRRSSHFLVAVSAGDWAGTMRDARHPGVTTQWTGALGILLHYFPRVSFEAAGIHIDGQPYTAAYQPDVSVLASARYPTVVLASLFVVGVYLVLSRTVGRFTGVLAAVFLALDTFFVALSRVLHHDALHALFALLCILGLGMALQGKGRIWFAVAGAAAALSFLSKSAAVVLVPLILAGAVSVTLFQPGTPRRWRNLLLGLLVCYGALALTVFIIFPAMWVQPVEALRRIFETVTTYASTPHEGGNFFWGEPVEDPGYFFYPVAILLRGSPFVLLGAALTLIPLAGWFFGKPRRAIGAREIWMILLWGTAVTYVLALTLGMKKVNRYMVPSLVAIDILGAIGLAYTGQLAWSRWKTAAGRWLLRAALALVVVAQVALCLNYYPYYFSYYNPLLGGGQMAQKLILVGWGEGYDQLIRYLNAKDNAENIVLSATHGSLLDFADFKGRVEMFPPRWSSEEPRYPMAQLDYVCVYLNWLQTHPVPDSFYDLFESREPEYTVRINGIEYLWLYKLAKEDYLSLPDDAVRADAGYANGLHLVGYKTFDASTNAGGGWLVPLQIYWQVERPCIKDYRLLLRLVDDSGEVRYSRKNYPAWGPDDCEKSEGAWRGDLIYPEEHWLEVGADVPAGQYALEAVIVHEPDEQPLPTVAGAYTIPLGEIRLALPE